MFCVKVGATLLCLVTIRVDRIPTSSEFTRSLALRRVQRFGPRIGTLELQTATGLLLHHELQRVIPGVRGGRYHIDRIPVGIPAQLVPAPKEPPIRRSRRPGGIPLS